MGRISTACPISVLKNDRKWKKKPFWFLNRFSTPRFDICFVSSIIALKIDANGCIFEYLQLFSQLVSSSVFFHHHIFLMGLCKKDVTPLLTQWSYVFLAQTDRLWVVSYPSSDLFPCCVWVCEGRVSAGITWSPHQPAFRKWLLTELIWGAGLGADEDGLQGEVMEQPWTAHWPGSSSHCSKLVCIWLKIINSSHFDADENQPGAFSVPVH